MKITCKINCENCNESLEWEFVVRQHISSSRFDVEVFNTKVYHPAKLADENENYLFEIQCKNCNKVNRFQVPKPRL